MDQYSYAGFGQPCDEGEVFDPYVGQCVAGQAPAPAPVPVYAPSPSGGATAPSSASLAPTTSERLLSALPWVVAAGVVVGVVYYVQKQKQKQKQ